MQGTGFLIGKIQEIFQGSENLFFIQSMDQPGFTPGSSIFMKHAFGDQFIEFATGGADFRFLVFSAFADSESGVFDLSSQAGPVGVIRCPALERLPVSFCRCYAFSHLNNILRTIS
jgi:hypothetical protein